MTDYNKVFLDTAPIIYFLDDDIHYGNKVRMIFEKILDLEKALVTSTITCEEYLVYPYKTLFNKNFLLSRIYTELFFQKNSR